MNQLVQMGYYDELIKYVTRINATTKKVTFDLPCYFEFQPEKTEAFADGWNHETVYADRPPTSFGLPQFGPPLRQIVTVRIWDIVVFDYLFRRISEEVALGGCGNFHHSLTVEF